MDVNEIIRLYTVENLSLRGVAERMNSNHHRIKRILLSNGIVVTNTGKKRKPFTEEHKRKIGESSKGRQSSWKGQKHTTENRYKNMASHLKYDVTLEFLCQFEIEKLKCLNKMIVKGERISKNFDTKIYMTYVTKFYNDPQFNRVFDIWISSGKDSLALPSLDHIIPLYRGGCNALDNLQVLTWFENRVKSTMTDEEWLEFKSKTDTQSKYFI